MNNNEIIMSESDMIKYLREVDENEIIDKNSHYYKKSDDELLNDAQVTEFYDWIEDGNVTKINGYFSTQDSQWTNRIESKKELYQYYKKF